MAPNSTNMMPLAPIEIVTFGRNQLLLQASESKESLSIDA